MTLHGQRWSVLHHVRWALSVLATLRVRNLAETKIHFGVSLDLNVPALGIER